MNQIELARQLKFVHEATDHNDGAWVEAILRTVGNAKGDPWCAAFVSFVLQIAYAGGNPLPMTASTNVLLEFAKKHNMLVLLPRAGDVFLILGKDGRSHHTGFCTGPAAQGIVPTIEGNTNPAGGREGYGVFERQRALNPLVVFIRLP